MARQKEVIEERYYMSQSWRWYRLIGKHKYRFTVRRSESELEMVAEMAIEKRQWKDVHRIRFTF